MGRNKEEVLAQVAHLSPAEQAWLMERLATRHAAAVPHASPPVPDHGNSTQTGMLPDQVNVVDLLASLAQQRPLFHAEADFQHALAWTMHQQLPNAQIRLELPLLIQVPSFLFER